MAEMRRKVGAAWKRLARPDLVIVGGPTAGLGISALGTTALGG